MSLSHFEPFEFLRWVWDEFEMSLRYVWDRVWDGFELRFDECCCDSLNDEFGILDEIGKRMQDLFECWRLVLSCLCCNGFVGWHPIQSCYCQIVTWKRSHSLTWKKHCSQDEYYSEMSCFETPMLPRVDARGWYSTHWIQSRSHAFYKRCVVKHTFSKHILLSQLHPTEIGHCARNFDIRHQSIACGWLD